ncbi:MAG: fibro-slime domain-containing protein [Lachnospiraceae bacterium]
MKSRCKKMMAMLLTLTMVMSNALVAGATDTAGGGDTTQATQATAEPSSNPAKDTEPKVEAPQEVSESVAEPVAEPVVEPVAEPVAEPVPQEVVPTMNTTAQFTYEFTDMTVDVNLETPESLPAGVTLEVLPIFNQVNEEKPNQTIQSYYDSFQALFEKQTAEQNIRMLEYLSYNIHFVKDGEVLEPSGKVSVSLKYKEGFILGNMLADGSNVEVYYLDDQSNAEALQLGQIADDKKVVSFNEDGTRINELSFETTNFEEFTIGTNDDATIEYQYEDDTVQATITTNRLDSAILGAEIQVTPVQEGKKYAETEKMLTEDAKAKGTEVGGFLAYDISFLKEGKEVEPSKAVSVSLHFKQSVKPEDVNSQEVTLGHIQEETNGNKKLETVEGAEIQKTEDAAVQNVNFVAANGFSIYTLTWKGSGSSTQTIQIKRIDTDGKEVGSDISGSITKNSSIKLSEVAGNIGGYRYAKSTVATDEKSAITEKVTQAYRVKYDRGWKYNSKSGGNYMPLDQSEQIFMIYEKEKPQPVDCDEKVIDLKKDPFDVWANASENNRNPYEVKFISHIDGKEGTYTRKFSASEIACYVEVNTEKYTLEKIEIQTSTTQNPIPYENQKQNVLFDISNRATAVHIYLKPTEVKPLTTVETIDSASKGVTIHMFDYDTKNGESEITKDTDIGGRYTKDATQGLLQPKLKNGVPVTKGGDSLDTAFSTKSKRYQGEANHLFLKSKYDVDGHFYYSSFDNYARFEGSDFTVYDQIGTPKDDKAIYFNRGNFMPYNGIEAGKTAKTAQNLYDENGEKLNTNDSRYGEPLYKTQGDNNYFFGMTVEAAFPQPQGGLDKNGKPVCFNFNGDDDMWVYIDDVLVLDIGGIHDARSGSINFATGKVTVKNEKGTTIKQMFQNAREDTSAFNGDTFGDYTEHTLKVFYMERGAGASNCKIDFNIPTVPKGSVNVEKEITNINEGAYSDVDFGFKLYVEDEKGTITGPNDSNTKYQLAKNQSYTLVDGNQEEEAKTTAADGKFYLKHGQKAQFNQLAERNKKYFVEEVDVVQQEYDDFQVNGAQIKDGNGALIKDEKAGTWIVRSQALTVGNSEAVTFRFLNHCAGTNQKNIMIQKQMSSGQISRDEFEMTVKIGGKLYTGVYYLNGSSIPETTPAEEGKINLKAKDRVEIRNIPSGTSFEVKESNLDALNNTTEKYQEPSYQVEGAEQIQTESEASGKLKLKSNATVTVTNTMKLSQLTIIKNIEGLESVNGDGIFTFKITCPDGVVLYKTMRFTEDSKTSQSVTIGNLPFGTYQVEELDTMRYTLQGEAVRSVELDTAEGETVTYTNKRTYESNYSHTDVVVNKFTVNADGSITCKPDKLTTETDAAKNVLNKKVDVSNLTNKTSLLNEDQDNQ